jgi:O-acetyl-ADP-ribose deacetylase (regulator of RNase III)
MKKKKSFMKVKPLKSYKKPEYPDKECYEANPYLLLSYVPGSWLKKPLTVGALLAFIFSGSTPTAANESLQAATTKNKNVMNKEKTAGDTNTNANNRVDEQKPDHQQESVAIAPLFIHGSGTGATGCIVMSPPVFLPEEEAIEIILSQLKKKGFHFEMRDHILPGVFTHKVIETYGAKWKPKQIELDVQYPFYFDLYDKQLNLGIKFVSADNYFKLGGPAYSASVQGYNMIDIAQAVREKLKDYNKTNAAVFYDPMVKEKYPRGSRQEALKQAGRELSNQVNNFIHWLKQEIISKEGNR